MMSKKRYKRMMKRFENDSSVSLGRKQFAGL